MVSSTTKSILARSISSQRCDSSATHRVMQWYSLIRTWATKKPTESQYIPHPQWRAAQKELSCPTRSGVKESFKPWATACPTSKSKTNSYFYESIRHRVQPNYVRRIKPFATVSIRSPTSRHLKWRRLAIAAYRMIVRGGMRSCRTSTGIDWHQKR